MQATRGQPSPPQKLSSFINIRSNINSLQDFQLNSKELHISKDIGARKAKTEKMTIVFFAPCTDCWFKAPAEWQRHGASKSTQMADVFQDTLKWSSYFDLDQKKSRLQVGKNAGSLKSMMDIFNFDAVSFGSRLSSCLLSNFVIPNHVYLVRILSK